ncbi:radical SAM protein [Desulfurobacterium atlanticum]|uniref:Radical SAM superfamily enzyme YgiQ, UPF0313 family n=1 Tax=Desulfurobacterium atlanticum TaxID=240169 RepID=A0A238YEE4_9BACT|nr:radical SAM protein [Desulfurobacterium atlanticum]SNR69656.1 Radical SAM superfamily enzyme YgiQ, UPF0313 family [Desulfurobacterium atlanticum]
MVLTPICNHLQASKNDLQVCLIYPGNSFSGFSSLAISNIYSTLNKIEGICCDIGFINHTESYFLEKPFNKFDILMFSITYEEHLLEVIKALEEWGIPSERKKRNSNFPLIFGGGIGIYYNPAPFFPIFDVIYLGEGEERLEEAFSNLPGKDKQKIKEIFDSFDNILIPEDYSFKYEKERVIEITGNRKRIFRSKEYPQRLSCSCFIVEETAFSNMGLIEINRGCIEKCRFCVASAMGLPYREKSIEILKKEIESLSEHTNTIGLIGTAVTDYSKLDKLYEILKGFNLKASFASLKANTSSDIVFKIIAESNQKTVTIAPETGSEIKRFALNKKVKDETFFHFCEKAFEAGVENLKLYFLTGIPEESSEDIEKIAVLTNKFREIALKYWKARKKTGKITVSVNPLIPKPFTPMQWYGMPKKSDIERRLRKIRTSILKIPNTNFNSENTKSAIFQAIISRGDERIGKAAIKMVKEKISFRKALREENLNMETLYTREREKDELFPWDLVESGIKREYLRNEYEKIFKGKVSPKCFNGCKICGLC